MTDPGSCSFILSLICVHRVLGTCCCLGWLVFVLTLDSGSGCLGCVRHDCVVIPCGLAQQGVVGKQKDDRLRYMK